jgi:hypothetical protein
MALLPAIMILMVRLYYIPFFLSIFVLRAITGYYGMVCVCPGFFGRGEAKWVRE